MNKICFSEKELAMIKAISPHWYSLCSDPKNYNSLMPPSRLQSTH